MSKHEIRFPQKFLESKYHSHSDWQLPRNIGPSDMDFILDNNGKVLVAEFKECSGDYDVADWRHVSYGQRCTNESLVRAGQGKITAVLCKHRPYDGKTCISSRNDVTSFQTMTLQNGEIVVAPVRDGKEWAKFVEMEWWYQ